jgi:hypothetical protein
MAELVSQAIPPPIGLAAGDRTAADARAELGKGEVAPCPSDAAPITTRPGAIQRGGGRDRGARAEPDARACGPRQPPRGSGRASARFTVSSTIEERRLATPGSVIKRRSANSA